MLVKRAYARRWQRVTDTPYANPEVVRHQSDQVTSSGHEDARDGSRRSFHSPVNHRIACVMIMLNLFARIRSSGSSRRIRFRMRKLFAGYEHEVRTTSETPLAHEHSTMSYMKAEML